MCGRFILFILLECTIAVIVASRTNVSADDCSTRLEYLEREFAKLTSIVKKLGDVSRPQVKREIERPVAFTAYIDADVHHMGINQPVPFNQVVSNIGDAFSVHTHIFTAPVTGIYIFTIVIAEISQSEMVARLVLDGQNIVDAITNPVAAGHDQQGVNKSAAIQVNKDQSVWVENYNRGDISVHSLDLYRFTSFSGVLVKEI